MTMELEVSDDAAWNTPVAFDRSLSSLLGKALRLRVYDERGAFDPAPKRYHRAESSLLLDVVNAEVVAGVTAALRVNPDCVIMDWMDMPRLWLQFTDDRGLNLAQIG